MPTIFHKIVRGEIPCHKIAENEHCLAFLDIGPLTAGHTLVIPKKETDYIFDVADPLYSELWTFARKVAVAVERAIPCRRIGISVIGLEVAHAHIHLIPINDVSDMNFSKPKLSFTDEQLAEVARSIREKLV